jgi:hypothetical protein
VRPRLLAPVAETHGGDHDGGDELGNVHDDPAEPARPDGVQGKREEQRYRAQGKGWSDDDFSKTCKHGAAPITTAAAGRAPPPK